MGRVIYISLSLSLSLSLSYIYIYNKPTHPNTLILIPQYSYPNTLILYYIWVYLLRYIRGYIEKL